MLDNFKIEENILFEDEVMIVIEKSAGLMVEPDRNNYPNLLNYVKNYLKSKSLSTTVYAQHIHRLDRPVAGVIVFAKDKSVLRNLSEQFAQRTVKKQYKAYTQYAPNTLTGVLKNYLRKEKKKAHIVTADTPYAEEVTLSYEITKLRNDLCEWDIELHTGKFHQIRAQLSHIGCPIIGDTYYGGAQYEIDNQIALQAYKLQITHPLTLKLMEFKVRKGLKIIQ